MDLKRFVGASTMALAVAVFAVAPLAAQTSDADDPEALADVFLADLGTCLDRRSTFDPGPTAACLSKTIVRHHDAMLPYAEIVIEDLYYWTADPDTDPILVDFALATAAALLSDPGLCDDLSGREIRAHCGAAIAQIDDDPRRCELLRDPRDAVSCLGSYIEIDPGDVGDCGRVGDIGIVGEDMGSLGDIGIVGEDVGRLTGADLCLDAAARLSDTPSLCREIENPELRSACILASMMPPPVGWTDIGICDEIVGINLNDPEQQIGLTSPEALREICGSMVVATLIDSPQALTICDEIETPILRDLCLAFSAIMQKDDSYCDRIASEALRKACLGALVGVADEDMPATDAFLKEFLAVLPDLDPPDQVAEGHFGDAAICTELLLEPADCTLRENWIIFKLSSDGDVGGTGMIVAEVPTVRLGGTSWDVGVEPCPVATARGEITLSGGFAGKFSHETIRGRAQVKWLFDPVTSPGEEARCGPKGLLDHDGLWEATLRDGSIDGALRSQSGLTVIPFIAEPEAE